jgi:hypothetical protein
MFAGHFAASVVAKTVAPRLPFWVCVGAAQLLDIGWATLVWAGVEQLRLDPALPGSPLVLFHMPWTHSLLMALLWSGLAGLLAVRLWGRDGWWIGAVVFSHWLADLLVHRPGLLLWPGGTVKYGLGLWNLPEIEMLVEIGLLAVVMAIWTAARVRARLATGPAIAWLVVLLGLTVVGDPPSPAGMALLAMTGYLAAMAAAWLVDRADSRLR